MLSLILVLLLIWFVLVVFLAAWTLWLQAYFYTEAVPGVVWRAPVAGSVIFLTILLWVSLDYQAPERYSTLWEFSAEDETIYPKLIVPHREDKREDTYHRVRRDRVYVYQGADRPMPSRPDKIIAVTETGERYIFEPDRDAKGMFKAGRGEFLKYREAITGQVMEEGQLGRVSTFHPGRLVLNLFLNFFLLLSCFGALWLLMRFQWSHALGTAVVMWGVLLLFIMPQILRLAETTARQPATAATEPAGQTRKGILLDWVCRNG